MANYATLKAAINNLNWDNGDNLISGPDVRNCLLSLINSLGAAYQIVGVATPETNPGTPDYNVAYIAGPGTYPNFSGAVIADGSLGILKYNGSWDVEVIQVGKNYDQQIDALNETVFGLNKTKSQTSTAPNWSTVNLITGLEIASGQTIEIMVNTSVPYTRLIVFYNGVNGNRIIDTTQNISGIWQEIIAPAEITQLDVYYIGGANATVTLSCQMGGMTGRIDLLAASVSELAQETQKMVSFKDGFVSLFESGEANASAPNFASDGLITGLNIPQGTTIRLRFDFTSTYSRLIVFCNGVNESEYRVLDTLDDIRGQWNEYIAPKNITQLGVYIVGATGSTTLNLYLQCGSYFFPNKSVDASKIADKAVEYRALADSVLEKFLPTFRTENMFVDAAIIDSAAIQNNGSITTPAPGWAISPLIPVTPGEKYRISCDVSGRDNGLNWYNSAKELLSTETTIYTVHTAPANAAYMQFNVASYNNYSTNIMVIHGEEILPYAPYIQTDAKYISGLQSLIESAVESALAGGSLAITKNGNTISVTDGTNTIGARLENNNGNIYGANPVFNFTNFSFGGLSHNNSDDVAPMHILNTTLGANHGQPCYIATISNHGLGNTAIGTAWVQDGKTFYIMRIVSANQIQFLSENTGTAIAPVFSSLSAGSISNGTDTLTISAVSGTQLYPGLKNHTFRLVLNGKKQITENGIYYADIFDVIEEYEIMNPDSTLQKIIARAGQSGDPVFDGDPAMRVRNIYRFDKTMSVIVIATVIPLQTVEFSNIMFAQAAIIADNATKYYVPNSLPLGGGGYDFRTPVAVNWSSSVPILTVGAAQMADVNNPVNRVIQYNDAKKVGFALGFVKGFGVGKNLLNYTGETFEIRNNTGKVYPHGVSSAKVGSRIEPGMIYQAVMYRSPFKYELAENRISMYHFELDGFEYVYVDYRATTTDNVIVSDLLNGKAIEIVESVNTELVTDVYNDGFIVKATYVANETCFIVVKIG